jgi:hypothetical protein
MPSSQRNHLLMKIALGAAIFALAILCILLFQQYQHIQRLGYIAAHRQSLFMSLRGSGPLTAADASSTQSWMTFDYIDRAFALPPQYLQTALGVTDSRYPRLTISEYATDMATSSLAALMKVQDAIRAYSSATSTPQR